MYIHMQIYSHTYIHSFMHTYLLTYIHMYIESRSIFLPMHVFVPDNIWLFRSQRNRYNNFRSGFLIRETTSEKRLKMCLRNFEWLLRNFRSDFSHQFEKENIERRRQLLQILNFKKFSTSSKS
jgi:hypothetical protein